jgi:hypothetical protein
VPTTGPTEYGPYYRVESDPGQTAEVAEQQERSGEIWGGVKRGIFHTPFPSVKAYAGPLPAGVRGVEFYTAVKPTDESPVMVQWYGTAGEEWAKIRVRITKNTQDTP